MDEWDNSTTVIAPENDHALNPYSAPESELVVSAPDREKIPFKLANLLTRFFGFIIDNVTLTTAIVIMREVVGVEVFNQLYDRGVEVMYWHYQLFCGINYLAISFLYFAALESSPWQASIGKRIMGIKVCDLQGHRLSFSRAAGRSFGRLISFATFWTGFMFALLNRQRQTLHDRLAGCLVIEE